MAISVRSWTAKHEHNVDRKYDPQVYKDTISSVLKQNENINTVILSVDNSILEQEYIDFLDSFQVKVILLHEEELNPLQHALMKLMVLSKCHYFICSRNSTFSEMVFWFGKCGQNVHPLF